MSSDPITERNRGAALAFLEAFSTRDPDRFLPMLVDDPTWRVFHSERRGREAIVELAEIAGRLYPHGTERYVQSVVADGDRVAVQSILTAVTNAGHDYENLYVMLFEFAADGRIDTVWEYLDLVYARARFDLPQA
jgi:ketosteroid isomerase-like protein